MHAIIAGSRNLTDQKLVYEFIQECIDKSLHPITEVVSGGARGVDWLGEKWAKEHNVQLTVMKPEWDALGKRAGMVRNGDMARYVIRRAAETGQHCCLILIWDGESKGSYGMKVVARGLKLWTCEKIITL